MKRIIALFLSCLLIFTFFNINCLALHRNIEKPFDIIYLDNGDYITIEIKSLENSRATNIKSGQKTLYYHAANDEIKWSAVLDATFSYTGYSAICTVAQITYTIYDSSWRIPSAVATKSANIATGTVTAKCYVLGVPVTTIERSFTLTCSPTGVIS